MLNKNSKLIEQGISYRRHLHKHPELSYEEFKTYDFIYNILSKIPKIQIDSSLKPSLLATLQLNTEGLIIAFRADIDALPVTEETSLAFKSVNPGIMHACMHDMHTATLLSLVQHIDMQKNNLKKIKAIKFIFQSAEENPEHGGGALKIVNSGFMNDVDFLFANHFDSSREINTVICSESPMSANIDVFTIELEGVGAHASRPHQAKDVIVAGSDLILQLQTVISRILNPLHPGVLSICDIHAGEGAFNILPRKLTIRGTLRTMYQEDRETCHKEIENKIRYISMANSVKGVYLPILGYPSTINNKECNEIIKKSLPSNIKFQSGILGMAGEDVSLLINACREKKGALFLTGVADKNIPESCFPLHSSKLEGNEKAMENALAEFLNIVDFFESKSQK